METFSLRDPPFPIIIYNFQLFRAHFFPFKVATKYETPTKRVLHHNTAFCYIQHLCTFIRIHYFDSNLLTVSLTEKCMLSGKKHLMHGSQCTQEPYSTKKRKHSLYLAVVACAQYTAPYLRERTKLTN